MGRPAFKITDRVIKRAEALARKGLTKEQIAHMLGIAYSTLNEKTKKYPEFSEAIKVGQSKGVAVISNALFNNAKNGSVTAQIFFLKNRSPNEWKDRVPEGTGETPVIPVSVNFTMIDGRKDASQSGTD